MAGRRIPRWRCRQRLTTPANVETGWRRDRWKRSANFGRRPRRTRRLRRPNARYRSRRARRRGASGVCYGAVIGPLRWGPLRSTSAGGAWARLVGESTTAGSRLPGWQISLSLTGDEPFDETARRQMQSLVWLGFLAVAAVAITAVIAGQAFCRHWQ